MLLYLDGIMMIMLEMNYILINKQLLTMTYTLLHAKLQGGMKYTLNRSQEKNKKSHFYYTQNKHKFYDENVQYHNKKIER
jgi:hypothetical protein